MAGAACKVIINGGIAALTHSLERILIEPELNGGKIDDKERRRMIQSLADLDQTVYAGGTVGMCLQEMMVRLEELGVLSADVWKIYTPPADQPDNLDTDRPTQQGFQG